MSDENVTPEEIQEQPQPTTEEQRIMQQKVQEHFARFKKKFKHKSKSELIALLWDQAVNLKSLQDIAKELYKENLALKNEKGE